MNLKNPLESWTEELKKKEAENLERLQDEWRQMHEKTKKGVLKIDQGYPNDYKPIGE